MNKIIIVLFLSILGTIPSLAQREEPRLIEALEDNNCEMYLRSMDFVFSEASKSPGSTVYAIVYEGKESVFSKKQKKSELLPPVHGQANAKIRAMKALISFKRFPIDRFVFKVGGKREKLSLEFWLIPPAGASPSLSPVTVDWKYRKGKPEGNCLDCCGL